MRYRRGLSTVVGAVFFIIATTTVVTYITYSMNSIDNFSQSVIVSESQNIDRGREEITISQVSIDGLKFNMTVTNTGSLPVKLTRLWVTNQDGVTADQKDDLNIQLNPGQQQYNIGQSSVIAADATASYNLKVVTERGNISTFQVSPNTSTRIQLITPGTIAPNTDFKIISLITNNSTTPNNIANLTPTMLSNVTLTLVEGPTPASIDALPQGSTAAFAWTYTAPTTSGGISMNASYTGAPTGRFVLSNFTNQLSAEAAAATSSQWSQAASRVGILISGIPNPLEGSASGGAYKFGIGVINPLDRPVDIYAVSISTPGSAYFGGTLAGYEPLTGLWSPKSSSSNSIIAWEGGSTPVVIPAESVGQFRVTSQGKSITTPTEYYLSIQALTSEGKLSAIYPVIVDNGYATINVYYTSNPAAPASNWGYLIKNIPSGKTNQIFNATVENTSSNSINSKIKLIILIPSDFTDVTDVTAGTGGWEEASKVTNPDGSTVLNVQTGATLKPFGTYAKTYQFSATAPTVSNTKLYVFQTTSVYVDSYNDSVQTASALSEAGVQVIP